LTMVCAQIMGNDTTISFAGSNGHFELNTPVNGSARPLFRISYFMFVFARMMKLIRSLVSLSNAQMPYTEIVSSKSDFEL